MRKINKAKWYQNELSNSGNVSADAITNCLKTTQNALSVWRVEKEGNVEDALLAIVVAGDKLETIDVIQLDEEEILSFGIKIEETPGITKIDDLIDTHRDLSDLNYTKIGIISNKIISKLIEDRDREKPKETPSKVRFTLKKIMEIVLKAIESGRLNKDDLSESQLKKLNLL